VSVFVFGFGFGFCWWWDRFVSFPFRIAPFPSFFACLPFLGNRAARARGVGKTNRISMEKIPELRGELPFIYDF
jgi:hypothetical protein